MIKHVRFLQILIFVFVILFLNYSRQAAAFSGQGTVRLDVLSGVSFKGVQSNVPGGLDVDLQNINNSAYEVLIESKSEDLNPEISSPVRVTLIF